MNPLFVPLTLVADCSVKLPDQLNTTLPPARLMLMAPGAPEVTTRLAAAVAVRVVRLLTTTE